MAHGADHFLDYTREHFAETGRRYDVLIDLYGNPSLSQCRRALEPGGTLVLIGGTGGRWFMGVDRWIRGLLVAPLLPIAVRARIHKDRREDLLTMKGMIEEEKVVPVLDRTFGLSDVPEAIEYVRNGRARGQVVVTI